MQGRAAVGLLLVVLLFVPCAAAHANYYRSEPPRGARLTEAPAEVSVTLSEPIDPRGSGLEVHDQDRRRVDIGAVRYTAGDTPVLSVDLLPDLPPGAYQARWSALSSVDGHVTSETFGFAVGGFEPPADAASSQDYEPLSAISRVFAYTGYALVFGVLAFAFYVDRSNPAPTLDRFRRRVVGLGSTLVLAGIAGLFAFTLQESALGAKGFLATGVGREFGVRLLFAVATCAVGIVAWRRGLGRGILILLSVLLFADAVGNSQFVHSAQKGWWATGIDLLHLVSVSLWLGGLALLLHFILHASRNGTYEDVVRVGHRFSNLALASVFVLGATGLASTFLILGTHPFRAPFALWTHPYGSFLAGKMLVFGAMLGLAGLNRFIFLGKRPGPDDAEQAPVYESLRPSRTNRGDRFARAVGLEVTLGLVVLVLAGFLTAVSPPSAEARIEPGGLQRLGFSDHYNITLRIHPEPAAGTTSNVSLRIELAGSGDPLDDAIRVRVTFASTQGNETGGESYTATRGGDGRWFVGDILFARSGDHEARVEVQTEDVYREVVTIPFRVA